jgi:Fe-S cluster assembly protein SufD
MAVVMETIYADAFKRFLSDADEPANLHALREEAFAYFTQTGFPSVRSEDWKYTNSAG